MSVRKRMKQYRLAGLVVVTLLALGSGTPARAVPSPQFYLERLMTASASYAPTNQGYTNLNVAIRQHTSGYDVDALDTTSTVTLTGYVRKPAPCEPYSKNVSGEYDAVVHIDPDSGLATATIQGMMQSSCSGVTTRNYGFVFTALLEDPLSSNYEKSDTCCSPNVGNKNEWRARRWNVPGSARWQWIHTTGDTQNPPLVYAIGTTPNDFIDYSVPNGEIESYESVTRTR